MPTYKFVGKTKLAIRDDENLPGIAMSSSYMEITVPPSVSTVIGTDFKPGQIVHVILLKKCTVQTDGSLKDGSGATITVTALSGSAGDGVGVIGQVLQQSV